MGRVGSVKIRGRHSRKRKQLERKHWKEVVEARCRKRTAVSGGTRPMKAAWRLELDHRAPSTTGSGGIWALPTGDGELLKVCEQAVTS